MRPPTIPSAQRPPAPPGPPASVDPQVGEQTVQRRLGRLFGESLFGAWPDAHTIMAGGHRPRRGRLYKRAGVVLLLALGGLAAVGYQRRGGGPRADQERTQLAGEVAGLLANGAFDHLGQALDRLWPFGKPLVAADPHLELILSAEAALYRYQDAKPERLARLEPYLSNPGNNPSRLLARLTVASHLERASNLDVLLKWPPTQPQGGDYHSLRATVHEERGEVEAARASWQRALDASPRWLPYRYLQCAFEARQHNAVALADLLGRMVALGPESPWTRMAQQQFGGAQPAGMPATAPPVVRYFAELAAVFPGLAARDLTTARQALGRALDAVDNQPAFVLDAFKRLRDAKADDLATELTSYEAWPRGNAWAKGALAALQASQNSPDRVALPSSARAGTPGEVRQTQARAAGSKRAGKHATAQKSGKVKRKTSRGHR